MVNSGATAHNGAPTLVGRHAPTGRGELLEWFNVLCCTAYETMEQLGDGVVYVQVLEMCLIEAPPFLHRLASFDCVDEPLGPASAASAGTLADRRERNLGLFQVVCREHLPKRLSIEINPKRLAEGKLQDHMILAKWLYGRVSEAAKGKGLRFVLTAESHRMQAACHPSRTHNNNGGTGGGRFAMGPSVASQLEPASDAIVRLRRARLSKELAFLDIERRSATTLQQPPQSQSQPQRGVPVATAEAAMTKKIFNANDYGAAAARDELDVDDGDDTHRQRMHRQSDRNVADKQAGGEGHGDVLGDPAIDAMLLELQQLLTVKARRTEVLQEHLAQFVEMRNGLAVVTQHVKDEAVAALATAHSVDPDGGTTGGRLDRASREVALFTLSVLERGMGDEGFDDTERTSSNVFAVIGEATRLRQH